jgi:WD40 repeat protein
MGMAAHCAVAGDNPRAVHTSRGERAEVHFAIECASPHLHVTATTTGVSLDPDGYSLCIDSYPSYWDYGDDCTYTSAIAANGDMTVSLSPGVHTVQLGDVALNCTVGDDNPRTVDTRGPTDVSFVITCIGAGRVRITTAATGIDFDSDGYNVCVDRAGSDCYISTRIAANGAVTFADVIAGPYTVRIADVAPNCTVSGATARAVTVPADGAVDITFNVGCVLADGIAYSSEGKITVSRFGPYAQAIIAPGFAPAWAPDGVRLAYECGGGPDICAINSDGTGLAKLTMAGTSNHHPAWSPDGLKIAYAALYKGAPELYVMAADGFGVVRLTGGVGFLGSPAWSPDGATIAFNCLVESGNVDICILNVDGSALARITTDPARDYGAAWSPDGSTLAFATTRYGSDEIALLNVAGGGVTRIGAGLPGFWPTWSPDGTQLAFVQTQDSNCGGWDYSRHPTSGVTGSARVRGAKDCSTYDAIVVSRSDGSNVRLLTLGNQPAWRPHR